MSSSIQVESASLSNWLQHSLLNNSDVSFATYRQGHPNAKNVQLTYELHEHCSSSCSSTLRTTILEMIDTIQKLEKKNLVY